MLIPLPGATAGRFLLRHGQSTANVDGLIASSPANAEAARGLTSTGRDQVRRSVMAARTAHLLPAASRVVSSPLLRARESAAIVAEVLGSEVRIDKRLIERGFGELELTSDNNYAQVWLADRADQTHQKWGVESVASILERTTELLLELARAEPGETFVLCTHGDVASVLLCHAAGRPLSDHRDVGTLENGELRALGPA